jgi:hypothetical protein
MTSRREFLQIGLAASALPLAAQTARAAGLADPSPAPVTLYKIVYDARFPESVAFGRRAAQLGVRAHAIEGDMTQFWYDDLSHRWKQGPVAIAGLTAHGPLFCFEQLGRDQRMRVVFRAEHRPTSAGVAHELSGPNALLDDARAAASRADWSAAMADVVTHCPSGRAEIGTALVSYRGVHAFPAALDGDALYSWVIAPAIPA